MIPMNNSMEEMREVMTSCSKIAIAGHQNPDGDAIGSCLALANVLHHMGKNVQVLLESYDEKYDLIPGKEFVTAESEYDNVSVELFIALDCGDLGRLGKAGAVFERTPKKMNIDHHVSNQCFGEYNYVDGDASSTAELIYRLIQDKLYLDKKIATGIYAGILYDTGGFRHTSTSPATMAAIAELLTYHIPFNAIYNAFFDRKSYQELKIIGRAFDNAKRLYDGKLIYSTISLEELKEYSCTAKDVGAVVSQLKGVAGSGVVCFLYEKAPGVVKVSFRSDAPYDVCKLAVKFGGGGHVRASGGTLNEPLEKALDIVLKEIKPMF